MTYNEMNAENLSHNRRKTNEIIPTGFKLKSQRDKSITIHINDQIVTRATNHKLIRWKIAKSQKTMLSLFFQSLKDGTWIESEPLDEKTCEGIP